MVRTPEEGRALRAAGLSVFAYADVWIFEDALRAQLEALRGAER
jgi:hypothetical protein